MATTLNLGSAIGRTGHHLTLTEIVQAVERTGLAIQALAVYPSVDSTEQTVVVGLRQWPSPLRGAIFALAQVLGQDCIAVHMTPAGAGRLIGPRADAWGDFDPAYFIGLDGEPLPESNRQAVAA